MRIVDRGGDSPLLIERDKRSFLDPHSMQYGKEVKSLRCEHGSVHGVIARSRIRVGPSIFSIPSYPQILCLEESKENQVLINMKGTIRTLFKYNDSPYCVYIPSKFC